VADAREKLADVMDEINHEVEKQEPVPQADGAEE
jgi:hypothetical protein